MTIVLKSIYRMIIWVLDSFMRRYKNQKLLNEINTAYWGEPDQVEDICLRSIRHRQRHLVEGDW
jgi:hypothetical protein